MLYFSYGSNMSVKRLNGRASSARVKTVATLHRHDLRFHKKSTDGSAKCDAHETNNPEHAVVGVVFEIAETDKRLLDRKEGLGYGYEQKVVTLTASCGATLRATTYYATHIDCDLQPYHWYKHHVLTGANENALPDEYVEKLRIIDSIADPKPERHVQEMAIYATTQLHREIARHTRVFPMDEGLGDREDKK